MTKTKEDKRNCNSPREIEVEIKQFDIFYADLGRIIGSEQGGKRPVLIIQNDTGNKYSPTTIVVPLTSRSKKMIPTHIHLEKSETNGLIKDSTILAEQIRTIDTSRILYKCGEITNEYQKEAIWSAIWIALKNIH